MMKVSPQETIRILLVCNQTIMRAGLRALIETWRGMTLVAETGNLADALALAANGKPDLILLDFDLSCNSCVLGFLPELSAASSNSRLLILTANGDRQAHQCAVRFGAVGLVQKDKAPEELRKAIEKVSAGEVWLDRSLTASVISQMLRNGEDNHCDAARAKIASLSAREREAFLLVGDGLQNKEIAKRLFISETTVRHHLTSVYSKLDLANRLELIIFRQQNKMMDLSVSIPPCSKPPRRGSPVATPSLPNLLPPRERGAQLHPSPSPK
jgi:two-component system, NarL family, nitrate/nitrite response regulator NarL